MRLSRLLDYFGFLPAPRPEPYDWQVRDPELLLPPAGHVRRVTEATAAPDLGRRIQVLTVGGPFDWDAELPELRLPAGSREPEAPAR